MLRQPLRKSKFLNSLIILAFCSIYLKGNLFAAQAIPEPGDKEGILNYSFEDVWTATEQILKDKALLNPQAQKSENIKINLVQDKDSGFISGNYVISDKYYPILFSEIFLIRPLESRKCRIYYTQIKHGICSGNTPINFYDGRCWGEIIDSGTAFLLSPVLELIEKRIRENNG